MYIFKVNRLSDTDYVELAKPDASTKISSFFSGGVTAPNIAGESETQRLIEKDQILPFGNTNIAIIRSDKDPKEAAKDVMRDLNTSPDDIQDLADLHQTGRLMGEATDEFDGKEMLSVEICPSVSNFLSDIAGDGESEVKTLRFADIEQSNGQVAWLYPWDGEMAMILTRDGVFDNFVSDKEVVGNVAGLSRSICQKPLPKMSIDFSAFKLGRETIYRSGEEFDASERAEEVQEVDVESLLGENIALINSTQPHKTMAAMAHEVKDVDPASAAAIACSGRGGTYKPGSDPMPAGTVSEASVILMDSLYDQRSAKRAQKQKPVSSSSKSSSESSGSQQSQSSSNSDPLTSSAKPLSNKSFVITGNPEKSSMTQADFKQEVRDNDGIISKGGVGPSVDYLVVSGTSMKKYGGNSETQKMKDARDCGVQMITWDGYRALLNDRIPDQSHLLQ